MANTFTNIVLHLVFAVKNRDSLLPENCLDDVYQYMGAALKQRGHYPIQIGGTQNHVHLLFRYNPSEKISDLVRDLKSSTSKFIYDRHFTPFRFNWQRGYGIFSGDCNNFDKLVHYIQNQKQHHENMGLRDEIRIILNRYKISYEEDYLFEDIK